MNLTWKILLVFVLFQIAVADEDYNHPDYCNTTNLLIGNRKIECYERELEKKCLNCTEHLVQFAIKHWKLDGIEFGASDLLVCVREELENTYSSLETSGEERNLVFITGGRNYVNFCNELSRRHFEVHAHRIGRFFLDIKYDCDCALRQVTKKSDGSLVVFRIFGKLFLLVLIVCIIRILWKRRAARRIRPNADAQPRVVLVETNQKRPTDPNTTV